MLSSLWDTCLAFVRESKRKRQRESEGIAIEGERATGGEMESEREGERKDPLRGHHSKMKGGLIESKGKPVRKQREPNRKLRRNQ